MPIVVPGALDVPDRPEWPALPRYSARMAVSLFNVYQLTGLGHYRLNYSQLGHGWASGLAKAERMLMLGLKEPMATPQLLRACYALSQIFAEKGEYELALRWTNEALESATKLDDLSALATLYAQRGACNACLLGFAAGVHDFGQSRALLRARFERDGIFERSADLHLTARMAHLLAFMGRLDEAESLRQEAQELAKDCVESDLQAADLAWLQSQLLLWKGRPKSALRAIEKTLVYYDRHAPCCSSVRAHIVAADIKIAWAERLAPGGELNLTMQSAYRDLVTVASQVEQISDGTGKALLELTRMAWLRLNDSARVNRVEKLEQVKNDAYRLGDQALILQAYTQLGQEFAWRGERESARHCFTFVIDELADSDLQGFGIVARKGLRRM